MIGDARSRITAALYARDLVCAISAHHFFDQIDIALQIPAVTRDLPLHDFGSTYFLQAESFQNLVDGSRFDRDANNAITFFVTERNIRWIWGNFTGDVDFLCWCAACDLLDQFSR